ncbi:acyl-CoA reductase [Pseudoalteromonas 'SMAR']|uniref:acyl-CoA reductase n=1 Tax=Pseudoalteromonas 'SMAR' TaxID=3416908 RepID=UPI003AF235DE
MIPLSENLKVLAGNLDDEPEYQAPLSNDLIDTVTAFSEFVFKTKPSAEIIALAFWFRRSNIHKVASLYEGAAIQGNFKTFHIAPANVDTVYLYTMLLSFLVGNTSIVRLSRRRGRIADELIRLLQKFMQEDKGQLLAQRCLLVEYDAEDVHITKAISKWCDKRVIWGGDDAIHKIRCTKKVDDELTFPDRFSVAVICLDSEEQVRAAAEGFVADYLAFNQQACSSPKAVYWYKTSAKLQQSFWHCVSELTAGKSQFDKSHQLNRHINLQLLLLDEPILNPVNIESDTNYLIVELQKLADLNCLQSHQGNGLIFSTNLITLSELPEHEKLQTVSFFGIGQADIVTINALRVVPLGDVLVFHHVWDGKDLITQLGCQSA